MNAYIVMEYDSMNYKINLPSELDNQFVHIPSDLNRLRLFLINSNSSIITEGLK